MSTEISAGEIRNRFYERFCNFYSSAFPDNPEKRSKTLPLWYPENVTFLDTLAAQNQYRMYKTNSQTTSFIPDFFLIGFEPTFLDGTVSFLEALAGKDILQECAFVSEGYDGTALLFSRYTPVTNTKLNSFYRKHAITPSGRDSFELREQQYARFEEIKELMLASPEKETEIKEKVREAMACLLKRERGYFFPYLIEQHQQGKPVIFLTTIAHAVSFSLSNMLHSSGLEYAAFVPRS